MSIEEQRNEILKHLIEALLTSMNTGDYFIIGKYIENAIKEMNPPKKRCSRCGSPMDFMEYYVKQGMCDKCAMEVSANDS